MQQSPRLTWIAIVIIQFPERNVALHLCTAPAERTLWSSLHHLVMPLTLRHITAGVRCRSGHLPNNGECQRKRKCAAFCIARLKFTALTVLTSLLSDILVEGHRAILPYTSKVGCAHCEEQYNSSNASFQIGPIGSPSIC